MTRATLRTSRKPCRKVRPLWRRALLAISPNLASLRPVVGAHKKTGPISTDQTPPTLRTLRKPCGKVGPLRHRALRAIWVNLATLRRVVDPHQKNRSFFL